MYAVAKNVPTVESCVPKPHAGFSIVWANV